MVLFDYLFSEFYDEAMAIESPQYEVLKKDDRIELRKYESYITANVEIMETSYNTAANKAFRILADYIFGNNTKQSKIAMTAPVMSQHAATSEKIAMTAPVNASKLGDQTYIISFTMPSSYSMHDLPKPNNRSIIIKEIPPHMVAVIEFAGYTTERKIEKLADELNTWVAQNKITLTGELTVSRYDPPWKLGLMRRNEISRIAKIKQ